MTLDLRGIPADIVELIRPHLDPSPETLNSISAALVEKRDAAKTARVSSGIETIWRECEEAYVGIDDANRAEWGDSKWAKPQAMSGPLTAGTTALSKKAEYKSTVFLRLTARYVDAGMAKLSDILLPPEDKAFSLKGTPLPELQKAKEDTTQVVHDGMGNVPLTRPLQPGETAPAQPPTTGAVAPMSPAPIVPPAATTGPAAGAVPAGPVGAPPQTEQRVPLTVKDLAEEAIKLADKKAKLAETRIWDWLVESFYVANMRKVIFDAAKLGSGVLKGPVPKVSEGVKVNASKEGGDEVDVRIRRVIQPGVSYISVWDCFPDPSCGENIHDGDYFFERDYLSDSQVRALKKLPGYIASQIDRALEIADNSLSMTVKASTPSQPSGDTPPKGRNEVWYYYGVLKRSEIDCMRVASGNKPYTEDQLAKDKQEVHAIVTMIGDIVVRAVLNPLDSGRYPYNILPWQRRAGYWAGIGVGEQIRAPQRMLNAAVRAMLNNAGKSSGSQIVINQSSIRPANGNWAMEPDKIWYQVGDSQLDDVRKAFYAFDIPNMTDEMLKIIDFAEKQAENVTSIPLVTQGQSGKTTPDTFSGMQLQDNNANQLLRSIGYNTDDCVTEPLIRAMYEWLLLDPKVPNEEKGDFKIDAHGSTALVERAIQDMTLASLVPVSKDPAFGINPKKAMAEYLRSRRIIPSRVQYTEEEQQKIDSTPPPEAPQVQAARIMAESRGAIAQSDAAVEQQRSAEDIALRREEMQNEKELRMLEYANKNGITLQQVKADLAKTAMTLQAQRELAAAENGVSLHMHHNRGDKDDKGEGGTKRQPRHKKSPIAGPAKPIAQLPGRAANGHAFTQGDGE